MNGIDSTEAIFNALNGPAALGRVVGVSTEHASALKRRGRIPPRYWPVLLIALRAKGHEITEVDLTRIYNSSDQPARPASVPTSEVASS